MYSECIRDAISDLFGSADALVSVEQALLLPMHATGNGHVLSLRQPQVVKTG